MLKTFYADTEQAALGLAQKFIERCDEYEQATLWGSGVNREGTAYATVQVFGLD